MQDQIDLTPRLHALLGVRVENLSLVSTDYRTGRTTSLQDTVTTPRFGLTYDLTDEVSVYGSYGRSFLPNTRNGSLGTALRFPTGRGLRSWH